MINDPTLGPAESVEGDSVLIMSPRTVRRSTEHFQSHFARDLAQTLPGSTNGYVPASSNGAVHVFPRVRFAVPNEHETLFPPGTISSSSLVWKRERAKEKTNN